MYTLSDMELETYIKEDLPYLDLTTHLIGRGQQPGRLEIFTREELVFACGEEARRIGELLGCGVAFCAASGQKVRQGETLIKLEGSSEQLHRAWRLVQIMLEYACKIATYTKQMDDSAKAHNPHCMILTTRKSFPFAKRFCIKSVLCGGGYPHRTGLSETVLIFEQHRELYGSNKEFLADLPRLRKEALEKRVIVESTSVEDAVALLDHGVEGIQLDKLGVEEVAAVVRHRQKHGYGAKIMAAGGIHRDNAGAYAAAGADGLVTSAPYGAKMADLGSKLEVTR